MNDPDMALNKQHMTKFIVLIPAYEPETALLALVDEIIDTGRAQPGFSGVLIINDGSVKPKAVAVINSLRDRTSIRVIDHNFNQGKGGALKTGFRSITENYPEVGYVVTADADGQHLSSDIFKLAKHAMANGNSNIGYRTFSHDVPLRSRIGNILTAGIFRIATGAQIYDTQSGLRTYLRDDLPRLCEISANGYEYEFHCLFDLAKNPQKKPDQFPIETVYEPGNPTSHFNPIMDSMRIYAVFFRYISISALSGAVDFLFFSIFTLFGMPTLISLILSRITSAPIYFYGMRNLVFRSDGNVILQAAGIISLMIIHIIFLWRLIGWLEMSYNVHPIGAMFAGLILFYLGNFVIQRFIIFPMRVGR